MYNSIVSDVVDIIYKSTVAFIVLFVLTRIMGKKQMSQLTYFDYVVGITIGSMATLIAIGSIDDFYHGILSMIIFSCFPIILSYISLKSLYLRNLLDGTPTILIQDGKIIEKNLKKSKININDLLEELRINKAFNISDVEFAILETSGKVSVEFKPNKQPATPEDLNIDVKYKGICTNLIIDGKVIYDNLNILNKDYLWLIDELKKQNVNSPDEVLLASLDNNNNLHIDKKNNDLTLKNI